MVLATVVWRADGRLLVTGFDAPVGQNRLVPTWAKIVDVATGVTEDVPDDEVGNGSKPPRKVRNAAGERLVATGKDGNAEVAIVGPSGSRTVLSVKDATPNWGIQSGPVFSPR